MEVAIDPTGRFAYVANDGGEERFRLRYQRERWGLDAGAEGRRLQRAPIRGEWRSIRRASSPT